MRHEKVRIFEKALAKVSANFNAEWAKAQVTQKEYIDKMDAHTAHAKHSLGLDNMLGEKKDEVNERERVRVQYPGYHGSLVTTQNSGYDWFPSVTNGWGPPT
jgi:hypothetical protein